MIDGTRARYVEAYELLTGRSFDDWYARGAERRRGPPVRLTPMRYEARVEITHLPGIADPQGATVERALPALGYDNVSHVRVGKSIRLVIDAPDDAAARAQVDEMCRRLLANPVIEAYEIELSELACDVSARVGVVLFPGTNCELDVACSGRAARRDARAALARRADSAASTRWSSPAGSPTATTCAPGRSPASRR